MRARRQGGRRHRFRTFLFVAIPLGALGAAVAYHLVVVATRVESARKTILTASALAERGNIAAADAQLVQAEVKMLEASRVINSSPDIVAVRWIPIIGQNLNSIRDMVGIGFQLVVGGRDILGAARPLADTSGQLQVPMRDGQIPVPVVQATQRAVDDLAGSLPAESDAPHSPFILPPISHLQKRIYAEAGRRKTQFRTVSAGLRLLADMSGANGPRRYLVMVSNEAEMRGTGGMYLHYAVISAADGKFRLDKVGPIDDLRLTQAPTVPTPPDYLQRFNALQPSLLWRNVNLTSDFNAAAPVVEAMYLQSGGDPLDGVIQIDSDGLAAILAGTGPVNVDPLGAVTAQNAVALTLNQEYVAFPDRDVRREFLGDVARATFDKLTTGNYTSLRPLATSLIRAAAARHVLINTTQPDAEKAVQELALDGQPPPSDSDFAELTVQNFSGNKLDYYLDSKLTVRGQRRAGHPSTLQATIDLTNTAPANGRPKYVFGPLDSSLQVGEYRGLVSLYLPRGTQLLGQKGSSAAIGTPTLASESDRTVVTFPASVQAGEHQSLVLQLELPSRATVGYEWQLVPVPRVRPTVVSLDVDLGNRRLRLTEPVTQPITLTD